MGWLRELMSEAQPPLRSFGALATRALAHADWPAETRPQPRSLASLLSKLDRGHDISWLEDRSDVQVILAELLGRAPQDLRAAWSPEAQRSVGQDAPPIARTFRFDDVPFARALDLVSEELPPGLPAMLTRPATWGRLLWRAPSGSGRSLAGSWLEARGLCALVRAPSAAQALARAPARGALFIELPVASADDFDAFVALDAARPICVALPYAATAAPLGWSMLEAPSPHTYARALVEWLSWRLPRDGRFEPAAVLAWLERGPLAEGVVDGFGSLLGLCGLADEVGVRALRGRSTPEIARSFVSERLGRAANKGSASAAWLKRAGFDMLVAIARRLLVHDAAELAAARPFEAWLDAVPAEHRRGPDVEWLQMALGRGDDGLRASDIERAARHVPPGAFRIVRGLEAASLLRPRGTDGLALSPRFLAAVLRREAERDLVHGSAMEWGEAMFCPQIAPDIVAALHERMLRDEAQLIEEVLELDDADSPELALAIEATLSSAGALLLEGGDLAADTLEALWDEALRLCVEMEGELPRPRIEHPAAVQEQSFLCSRGSYYLGALALSERLAAAAGRRHDLLRPWAGTRPPKGIGDLFDRILLDLPLAPPLVTSAAFALVDRLRTAIGASAAPPHVLEQPGILLDEIEHDVLDWASVIGLERHPLALPALVALAEGRGLSKSRVATALWHAWDAAAQADIALFDRARSTGDARLCAVLGSLIALAAPRLLLDLLRRGALDLVTWSELDDTRWQALARAACAGVVLPAAAWNAMPDSVLRVTLDGETPIDDSALRALWQRAPERVAARLARAAAERDEAMFVALLRSAPAAVTPEIARSLEPHAARGSLLELPEAALHALRAQLHARLAERATGHQLAYAMLARIERALTPAKRAIERS